MCYTEIYLQQVIRYLTRYPTRLTDSLSVFYYNLLTTSVITNHSKFINNKGRGKFLIILSYSL